METVIDQVNRRMNRERMAKRAAKYLQKIPPVDRIKLISMFCQCTGELIDE